MSRRKRGLHGPWERRRPAGILREQDLDRDETARRQRAKRLCRVLVLVLEAEVG